MSTKPQSLKKVIDDLRQIIVGQVAMPHDQIDQITLFIFIKQLSRMNDELVRLGSREIIFTGQYERYHYDVLICLSGEELVKECRQAVESLYTNTAIEPTIRKLFERSYLKIMDSKVLSRFLAYLTENITDDMDMGDFYESLLPILGTQNELGQFRTPRHVIDFIVQIIDPKIGETICDPACGTAGFLISAFKYLCKKYSDDRGNLTLNPAQLKMLYTSTIFGWDIEPLMVKFSLANLYLHGLKNPNVAGNDTLLNENLWQGSDDIIIANPPFITPKGGAARHARFTNKSNKTEVLFLEWMVHHLNYNGRMGVIVPEGIIFDSSKGHTEIRKQMIDSGLWCVVSLPANVFQPYSGVKTSIVFVDKALQSDKVLFCKIENHGYSLNTNPSAIDKNDLPAAIQHAIAFKDAVLNHTVYKVPDRNVILIEKTKLLANRNYALNVEMYLLAPKRNTNYPVCNLCVLLTAITPPNKIKQSDYLLSGKYPVVDQSQNDVAGWTNDESSLLSPDKPVVVFGDHTCCIKYLDFPFCQGADGIKILKSNDNLLPKFLYYYLKTNPLESDGYNRHYSKLMRYIIPLPPLQIQEEIVTELDSYQKIINGARQVVDSWKPRIDIDPEWETVCLEKVCYIQSGGTPRREIKEYWHGDIPWVGSSVCKDEYVNEAKEYITNEGLINSSAKIFAPCTTLIALVGATIGKTGYLSFACTTNQNIAGIKPKNDSYLNHLFLFYVSQLLYHDFMKLGEGKFRMANLSFIRTLQIPVPDMSTQQAIVERIENERKLVDANRQLIALFEGKIKKRMDKIFSSE